MINSSVSYLRSEFKTHILNNTVHKLLPPLDSFESPSPFPSDPDIIHFLPRNYDTLVCYFVHYQKAILWAEQNYNPHRVINNSFIDVGPKFSLDSDHHLPTLLITEDVNVANLFFSIVAWLTIDDFRWHHLYPSIPEDLNYGLVLQYPDYVLPLVEFIYYKDKDFPVEVSGNILDCCTNFVKNYYKL